MHLTDTQKEEVVTVSAASALAILIFPRLAAKRCLNEKNLFYAEPKFFFFSESESTEDINLIIKTNIKNEVFLKNKK